MMPLNVYVQLCIIYFSFIHLLIYFQEYKLFSDAHVIRHFNQVNRKGNNYNKKGGGTEEWGEELIRGVIPEKRSLNYKTLLQPAQNHQSALNLGWDPFLMSLCGSRYIRKVLISVQVKAGEGDVLHLKSDNRQVNVFMFPLRNVILVKYEGRLIKIK